jgi:hypothetical protein
MKNYVGKNMTNVPTVEAILAFIALLTFLPFATGFVFSHIFFRNTKISLLGGIISLPLFILIWFIINLPIFFDALFAGLLSSILIGFILYKFKNWEISTIKSNVKDTLKVFNRRSLSLFFIAILMLISVVLYGLNQEKELEFKVNDPKGDMSYRELNGSGYELRGYDHIDITRLESKIVGDSVVLEMELAGNMSEKKAAEYDFIIYTTRYSSPDTSISRREMEENGNILRGYIPLKSLEGRNIFVVAAVSSDYTYNPNLNREGVFDRCSKERTLGGYLQSAEYLQKILLTPLGSTLYIVR